MINEKEPKTDNDRKAEILKLIEANLTITQTLIMEQLDLTRKQVQNDMKEIAEAVEKAMIENSRIALDQEEYRRKNDELAVQFDNARVKYDELECKISDINNRSTNLRHFQETVESLKGQIIEFDTVLWGSLVDYIVINDDGSKIVVSRDGTQI